MITTATGKNQITIPAELAKQLDLQPGTRLDWSPCEDSVLIARRYHDVVSWRAKLLGSDESGSSQVPTRWRR